MINILILAVIVAVLVYQLRRVLGERTGSEPTPGPDPFAPVAAAQNSGSPLSRALNAKPVAASVLPDGVPASTEPLSINQGLQQIRDYDSVFDERSFLQGARSAFEMIIKAYARGDLETLKPLLSPELYDQFSADAKSRAKSGMVMETTLQRLTSATIMAARMIGFDAEVRVEFVSEQITFIRNSAGDVVSGDPKSTEEVRDTWTFRRDTRGQDPVWHLQDTHA